VTASQAASEDADAEGPALEGSGPQGTGPEAGAAAPPRRPYAWLLEVIETVVLTVILFVGIQTFVAQPYEVRQMSMQSTLQPGHYVLVDKLTPLWAPYNRGDIVVFRPPGTVGDVVPLIKRVVGLPGDTIELRDGLVVVNGVELDEPYLHRDANGDREPTDPGFDGTTSWRVGDRQVLVMGDHRQESSDSRGFGAVDVSSVIGRAWLRYWPLDVFGVLERPAYAELEGSST
jgi:signal peptidase I